MSPVQSVRRPQTLRFPRYCPCRYFITYRNGCPPIQGDYSPEYYHPGPQHFHGTLCKQDCAVTFTISRDGLVISANLLRFNVRPDHIFARLSGVACMVVEPSHSHPEKWARLLIILTTYFSSIRAQIFISRCSIRVWQEVPAVLAI